MCSSHNLYSVIQERTPYLMTAHGVTHGVVLRLLKGLSIGDVYIDNYYTKPYPFYLAAAAWVWSTWY